MATSRDVTCWMAIFGFASRSTKNMMRLSTVAATTRMPPKSPLKYRIPLIIHSKPTI